MSALDEKRNEALERLRKRRGSARKTTHDKVQGGDLDHIQLVIKTYKSRKASQEAELDIEQAASDVVYSDESPLKQEPSNEVAKVARHRRKINKRDEKAGAAVKRWKEFMEARAEQTMADSIGGAPLTTVSQIDRRKMVSDLLSVDFLENTQHWLSSAKGEPDYSSTPLEEVEELYRQTQYRHKVLKVLTDLNQQNLDAIELYMRNAKITQSQK